MTHFVRIILFTLGFVILALGFQNCSEQNTGNFEKAQSAVTENNQWPSQTPAEEDTTPSEPTLEPPQTPYKGLYGFKAFAPPNNVITLQPGQDIGPALTQLTALGGGTLNLQAGMYTADQARMGPNTVIKGMGVGVTVIRNAGTLHGIVIDSPASNFELRDFTLDATNNGGDGIIVFGAADNVLVANIEVIGAMFSGVAVYNDVVDDFSEDITFDNVNAHDAVVYNGFFMLKVKNGAITNNIGHNNTQYGAYIRESQFIDIGFNDLTNNVGPALVLENSTDILDHDNLK